MMRLKPLAIAGLVLIFLSLFLAFKSQYIYYYNYIGPHTVVSGEQMAYYSGFIFIALVIVLIGSYLIYRSGFPEHKRSTGSFLGGLLMIAISVFAWVGTGSLPNNPGTGLYYSPITVAIATVFTAVGLWIIFSSGYGKRASIHPEVDK